MTDNKGQKGDHVVTNDEEGIEALYQYITEKCNVFGNVKKNMILVNFLL